MGRSSERSVEILGAARALFAENGFEGTSISDIAGAVGVADGAIYKHFPSKRAVLYEVIREFYEPVIDNASANVLGISGTRERLRYLIWLQLRAFTEQPELCRLIIAEARPMEDYYESKIADLNRRYTSLLVDVVRTGQVEGVFRGDIAPTMIRDLVYGGIEHIAWGAATGRSTIDVDEVADDLTRLVCQGLEPRPATADQLGVRVTRLENLIERDQG
ncbi:MAG: TetR/AcrR family transcriptional regulator [Actinomycetota bacterium]|nr:TetR/AcrR family transcriptional regulator [Actinomycetota bacterium]